MCNKQQKRIARPTHLNDKQRSLAGLGDLAPLWQVPGVCFVRLQKGEGEDEASHPPEGQALQAFTGELSNFADTAALISQLDLVICVHTAVAHLSGALGKPCWILLPGVGLDWRWLLARDDSPWYPGVMRLFRQAPEEGNWQGVIQQVAEELATFVATRTPTGNDGFLQQAMTHWQAGRSDQALRLARQGLAAHPGQVALLNLAGIALTQLGRGSEALDSLHEALQRAPDAADIHYNLGLAYQSLQDLDAAETSYRAALDLLPLLLDHAGKGLGADLVDEDLDPGLEQVVAAAEQVVDPEDRLEVQSRCCFGRNGRTTLPIIGVRPWPPPTSIS